jgi:hypothetical protein
MPILCDPDQLYPIVLDSDKGKENPPTFFAKALSGRQQQRNKEKIQEFKSDLEGFEFLPSIIFGWKNMKDSKENEIVFSSDAMMDLLVNSEVWELIRTVQSNGHLQPDEKKS